MKVCKKCDVEVDTIGEFCPLCNSFIGQNRDSSYPVIKTTSVWNFVKRLMLLVIVAISSIVALLNYTLTPNTSWSLFVIVGLVSMYAIFLGVMKGRRRIVAMMFYMCFLIILITITWDNLIGYRGWSINYVMPSLAISYGLFLIVMRFISNFSLRDNTIYIYLHILLEFLPLALYYKNIVTFKPLAVISAVFGIINLLVLLVFDFSHFKKDIAMRLHI